MEYFNGIKTIEDLKKRYKKLAFENHPDRGGSEQIMKEINNEYDTLFEQMKRGENVSAAEKNESAADFRDFITRLMRMEGLNIEICGCWLWIGGNTKIHKEELKALGFKWSGTKKLWYWAPYKTSKRRGTSNMNKIRAKYGSVKIEAEGSMNMAAA